MTNNLTNTIYHYTDWKAFEDIICNKRIHLSNIKLSNDSNEIVEFLSAYDCQPLIELAYKINKKLKLDYDLSKTNLVNIFINRVSSFSFCFTKNKDDAAQWDRYANKGLGVCIGFNEDYIKLIKPPFRYEQVKYEFSIDEKKVEKSINALNEFIKNISKISINSKILEDFENKIWNLFYDLYLKSFFYKNNSFKSENEYRLCIASMELQNIRKNNNLTDAEKLLNSSEIKYLVTNDKIREYIDFKMNEFCDYHKVDYCNLINEIIVGPKSIMNEELVKRFLEYKELHELTSKVKKSKSSLR